MVEVSVITPTYNRRKFIPTAIQIYKNYDYPKDKMEWIIIDDGKESVEDLFLEASKTIPNIKYIRYEKKLKLGEKRNELNAEAKGKIIICMDDDDYYPPERIKNVVRGFNTFPEVDLAGSSEMYFYFIGEKTIYKIERLHPCHATNGTLAYRKKYTNSHSYNPFAITGEEGVFLDHYQNDMIQLNPFCTILVICHDDNSINKSSFKTHPKVKKTSLKLRDFIKDKRIREFYQNFTSSP